MIVESLIQSSCEFTIDPADSYSDIAEYSRISIIEGGIEKEIWRGEKFDWEAYKRKGGKHFIKE